MERIDFEGINLAELLPRIPDSIKNDLPFGMVKLDTTGKILEYNMAEGDLTGVDPKSAIGKNFFDDIAVCTKTQAFYGKFLEGVKKGFVNTVFDYTFDHREVAARVRVHMVSLPNHLGQMQIVLMVARVNSRPAVTEAHQALAPAAPVAPAQVHSSQAVSAAPVSEAPAFSVEDIVKAVLAAMGGPAAAATAAPAAAPVQVVAAQAAPAPDPSRHQDILKF